MTPEMALRMRVLLEAFCAALTGLFPWSRRLKAAFAAAFAWLDQVAIAAAPEVVDVTLGVVDAAVPETGARRVRAVGVRRGKTVRRPVVDVVAEIIGFVPGYAVRPGVAAAGCVSTRGAAVISGWAIFAKG